jgi:hypothetical protein
MGNGVRRQLCGAPATCVGRGPAGEELRSTRGRRREPCSGWAYCPPSTLARTPLTQVEVSAEGDTQVIRATTDLEAGRLLLHWGVEGGKDYKGGWRLPAEDCRPEGTRQYKDRALQTPFR